MPDVRRRGPRTGGPGFAAALAVTALTISLPAGAASGSSPRDSTAPAAAAAFEAPPLLPDLRPMAASELSVQRVDGERYLRFTAALANVGRGPLEVRPGRTRDCPAGQRFASQILYRDVDGNGRYRRTVDTGTHRRPAGCMVFHPQHDHWHFDAAARYTLVTAEEATLVATRPKTSFCLRDIRRVPESWDVTTRYAAYYGACERDTPQGISIGWADVYDSSLPGQRVRLPRGLADGVYCLRVTVDPQDRLKEVGEANNRSVRALRLTGDSVRAVPGGPCR